MSQDVAINTNATGDGELVAAPGPYRFIRVLNYHMSSAGTVTVQFKSGESTVLGGAAMVAGSQANASEEGGDGIFDCANNEALNINLGAGVAVIGSLRYTVKGFPGTPNG